MMIFGHDTGSAEVPHVDDLVKQIARDTDTLKALSAFLAAHQAATRAAAHVVGGCVL